MKTIKINSTTHNQFIDITAQVEAAVKEMGIRNGICLIYTPHTTAAITINENADPDVVSDMIMGFNSLDFEKLPFNHMEGNSASHICSSIVGCSESFIVENSQLVLGTWQGIYFCEFDGPRPQRKVYITTR